MAHVQLNGNKVALTRHFFSYTYCITLSLRTSPPLPDVCVFQCSILSASAVHVVLVEISIAVGNSMELR